MPFDESTPPRDDHQISGQPHAEVPEFPDGTYGHQTADDDKPPKYLEHVDDPTPLSEDEEAKGLREHAAHLRGIVRESEQFEPEDQEDLEFRTQQNARNLRNAEYSEQVASEIEDQARQTSHVADPELSQDSESASEIAAEIGESTLGPEEIVRQAIEDFKNEYAHIAEPDSPEGDTLMDRLRSSTGHAINTLHKVDEAKAMELKREIDQALIDARDGKFVSENEEVKELPPSQELGRAISHFVTEHRKLANLSSPEAKDLIDELNRVAEENYPKMDSETADHFRQRIDEVLAEARGEALKEAGSEVLEQAGVEEPEHQEDSSEEGEREAEHKDKRAELEEHEATFGISEEERLAWSRQEQRKQREKLQALDDPNWGSKYLIEELRRYGRSPSMDKLLDDPNTTIEDVKSYFRGEYESFLRMFEHTEQEAKENLEMLGRGES